MELFREFPIVETSDPREKKLSRTQLLAEHATSVFLLTALYRQLLGRSLKIEHSLGDGFYFEDMEGAPITEEIIGKLKAGLIEILNSDAPIQLLTMGREKLLKYFSDNHLEDKVAILKAWQASEIPVVQCRDFLDYVIEPMSTDKERLKVFELMLYDKGLLMRLPTMLNPTGLRQFKDPAVFHKMFAEYDRWAKLIHVDNVRQLNEAIYRGKIDKVRLVAEGLHEQKFAWIAKELCKGFESKRVVTVAGPSSSNKTTFAKRLEIQLNVNGYRATVIEMDDYFKDTKDIPVGPDGLQDFEHISAMNVELLGQRVHELLEGKEIPLRKFNFKEGRGLDDPTKKLRLKPNSFLILEGIHGLNPELLQHIGRELVVPIYVSALTPLNIDHNHRFPTSDLRLIRRIIRDNQFRGVSPRKTIKRWTSVRVGEERNIFPYQENAVMFFNSSLVYELPVLSIYAKVLLCEATVPEADEDPESSEAKEISKEARRLLALIELIYPLSPEYVSPISCIREFIGGSEFEE